MAGTFPDPPGHRFALDADGSIFGYTRSSQSYNVFNNADNQWTAINDESEATYWGLGNQTPNETWRFTVLFPEPRNLSGYFMRLYRPNISGAIWDVRTIEVSVDTTNGVDGSWTALQSPVYDERGTQPYFRTAIDAITAAEGVTGIRFPFYRNADTSGTDFRIYSLHLYGTIPAGANDQRIAFWHATEDQEIGYAYFDMGDMEIGVVQTKAFRLKNLHSALTANSIAVDIQDINPSAPLGAGLQVSTDGVTWMSTVNIGNLGPGQVSSVLYMRLTMPSLAVNPYAARFRALPASWA